MWLIIDGQWLYAPARAGPGGWRWVAVALRDRLTGAIYPLLAGLSPEDAAAGFARAGEEGKEGTMTEQERAVLDAVHAYLRARYDAFQRAQQGDRQAYEERKARVDDLSRAMLAAIMAIGPRHPNDRHAFPPASEGAPPMSTPHPGPGEADLAEIEERWADARPFGEKVREARLARGLSMRALGEAVGVSVQYINDIEHGARHARERRTIIAEALGFRHVEPVEHARADVAALLAEVRALRAENAALREGEYPPPEKSRPLRDFLGVLPPLPRGQSAEGADGGAGREEASVHVRA